MTDETRDLLEELAHAQDVIRAVLADAQRRGMSADLILELQALLAQTSRAKRLVLAIAKGESAARAA